MSLFPTSDNPPDPQAADQQAPLGAHPTYDDVLDVAVQYTFPCSDPIAAEAAAHQPAESIGTSNAPERDSGPQTPETSSRPH